MNPLLLSLFASLSTIIGLLFILKKSKNILNFSLSFAAGVMLTVSFLDLIPEAIIKINNYFYIFLTIIIIGIFFSIGVIISFLIDKYLPDDNSELYKVGIISLIAIITHNIPEGIATYIVGSIDIKLGLKLAISIALHNIPEGITIAVPIYYATNNKLKAIIYTIIAGLSEFFGSLIAFFFLKNLINDLYIGFVLSIIAGIMFQISIYELLPNVRKGKRVGMYFILGVIIMILSIIII